MVPSLRTNKSLRGEKRSQHLYVRGRRIDGIDWGHSFFELLVFWEENKRWEEEEGEEGEEEE